MTNASSPSAARLLLEAAAAAAAGQQYPAGCLYVVATPIGNLADLTLRAIHVLSLCDVLACEDTRVSAGLLRHLGLTRPLVALHAHNEAEAAEGLLARLRHGERVALVSDAGTPAISDPGARLVAAAHAAGLRVMPLPGASSVAAAVSAAGDAHGAGFRFVGFLPAKGAERAEALQRLLAAGETTVLFEAPHRVVALADALAQASSGGTVTVCRELSKQFEQIQSMPVAALPAWLSADENRRRGEFVLVLHAPAEAPAASDATRAAHDRLLSALLAELPLRQAVSIAAAACDAPRNALYARALELKARAGQDDEPA